MYPKNIQLDSEHKKHCRSAFKHRNLSTVLLNKIFKDRLRNSDILVHNCKVRVPPPFGRASDFKQQMNMLRGCTAFERREFRPYRMSTDT